ncbi:transcriptional regulator, HxlR family [Actinacidiphila rubida]|uniref:Transcriptional regulator, HxlR family n=1 Tax=Actinacidiphila rubida TaxID=310780 RepID=A0A1H8RSK2_9ACTN|nr:helix-turn-helix domain-containing protein [Actinacidiphila rubida]SEO69154.1 transcriptional regulator, HxlR family [Actinacidiphila rubida]
MGSTTTASSATARRSATAAVVPVECTVTPLLDVAFSRWTTPVLWTLNEFGRQRFVELERRLGGITPKVLTQRLRQLERDGLVIRTYHPEVPPRVEYEISELGRTLGPLFATMAAWAQEHIGEVEAARVVYDEDGRPGP